MINQSSLTVAMNSPEPISPSASTSSSGSPPPEEVTLQPSSGYLSSLTSHLTTAFVRNTAGGPSSSSSKRRLPAGSTYGPGQSDRDPKTRKKTCDIGSRNNTLYEGQRENVAKKDKEELIDSNTVEWLRKGVIFKIPLRIVHLISISRNRGSFLRTGLQILISVWIVLQVSSLSLNSCNIVATFEQIVSVVHPLFCIAVVLSIHDTPSNGAANIDLSFFSIRRLCCRYCCQVLSYDQVLLSFDAEWNGPFLNVYLSRNQ